MSTLQAILSRTLYYYALCLILLSLYRNIAATESPSTQGNATTSRFWENYKHQSKDSLSRQSRMAPNSTTLNLQKRQVWPKLSPVPSYGLNIQVKQEPPNYRTRHQNKTRRQNYVDKSLFMGALSAYRITTAAMALTVTLPIQYEYALHSPKKAAYFHDLYRWFLRTLMTLKNVPTAKNLGEALQPWKFRFKYPFDLVPPTLRGALFWIDKEDWMKEDRYMKLFRRWAVRAYGKSMDFWRNSYTFERIRNAFGGHYDVRDTWISRELIYYDEYV